MDAHVDEQRLLRLETVLQEEQLLPTRFKGTERVSETYSYELELMSSNFDIAPAQLLGTSATIHVNRPGSAPWSGNGIISHFGVTGRHNIRDLCIYSVRIVPPLWLLTRTTDCRIFQDKAVREIVSLLLAEHRITGSVWHLIRSYDKLEYCVQYRETTYDFVCRILEKEGIFFYFKQLDGACSIVFADNNNGLYRSGCPNLSIVPRDSGLSGIWEWESNFRIRSGLWALSDFNFEAPSTDLTTESKSINTVLNEKPLSMFDYPGHYARKSTGDSLARNRMEYEEAAYQTIVAESDCTGLSSGCWFPLSDESNVPASEYYLTEIEHHGIDESFRTSGGSPPSYRNRFHCRSRLVPHRPGMKTSAPRIHGVQTAIVAGPGGSEVFTDKYGRVKVHFHWDRHGKGGERSSCWIRVAQGWAGRGWGGWFVPRIGQEVVVVFLEGDPDRPLIVGSVYNAEQVVPFGLPANATQSGLRTRSSTGGGPANCNELRFEDRAGKEQVYVHAERDLDTSVEHDESRLVGHDQQTTVKHDQSLTVQNNQTTTVQHDQTLGVHHNRRKSVTADETTMVGGNRTETVSKNESVSISMARTHTVTLADTLTVGAARTHTVGAVEAITVIGARTVKVGAYQSVDVSGAQSIKVGMSQTVSVQSNQTDTIGGNDKRSVGKDRAAKITGNDNLDVGKELTIEAGDKIVLKTGSATITMTKDGNIVIDGNKITISGSSDVYVEGKNIHLN